MKNKIIYIKYMIFGFVDDNFNINIYSEHECKILYDALIDNWNSITIINKNNFISHIINFNTGIIKISNSYKIYQLIRNNKLYIRIPYEKDIKLINEKSYYKEKIECFICMENEKNMILTCGHAFCYNCVIKLDICPMCRKSIIYGSIKRIFFN